MRVVSPQFSVSRSLLPFALSGASAGIVSLVLVRMLGGEPSAFATLVLTACPIFVSAGLGWVYAGRRADRLAGLQRVAEALANGDLDARAERSVDDEFESVASSMEVARVELRKLRLDANGQAKSLASSSERVAMLTDELGSGAEEAAEEAASGQLAVERLRSLIQSASVNVSGISNSIQRVSRSATDAALVAASAVRVKNATNAKIVKLADSTAEIANVIRVINSIAEQTNLLALNATIEAARAGESGRGFSVVANEVKELARETAHATEEISRKIAAIQVDSKDAVEAIQELNSVVQKISDFQSSIAEAVDEQSVMTSEISRNVSDAEEASVKAAASVSSVAGFIKGTSKNTALSRGAAAELAEAMRALVGTTNGQVRAQQGTGQGGASGGRSRDLSN